eukprot:100278_1
MSSWFKVGSYIEVNGSIITKDRHNGTNIAYGVQEVESGQHQWKVKVIRERKNGGAIEIGISSNTNYCEKRWEYDQKDTFYYLYYSTGGTAHQGGHTNYDYNNGAAAYSTGDIITVHLDLDKNTLEFSKNGNRLGIAYENVEAQQKYRLTVSLRYRSNKVDMVSYVNLCEEEKENNVDNTDYIKQCLALIKKQYDHLGEQYNSDQIKQFDAPRLNNVATYLSKVSDDLNTLEMEIKKCKSRLQQSHNTLKKHTK